MHEGTACRVNFKRCSTATLDASSSSDGRGDPLPRQPVRFDRCIRFGLATASRIEPSRRTLGDALPCQGESSKSTWASIRRLVGATVGHCGAYAPLWAAVWRGAFVIPSSPAATAPQNGAHAPPRAKVERYRIEQGRPACKVAQTPCKGGAKPCARGRYLIIYI